MDSTLVPFPFKVIWFLSKLTGLTSTSRKCVLIIHFILICSGLYSMLQHSIAETNKNHLGNSFQLITPLLGFTHYVIALFTARLVKFDLLIGEFKKYYYLKKYNQRIPDLFVLYRLIYGLLFLAIDIKVYGWWEDIYSLIYIATSCCSFSTRAIVTEHFCSYFRQCAKCLANNIVQIENCVVTMPFNHSSYKIENIIKLQHDLLKTCKKLNNNYSLYLVVALTIVFYNTTRGIYYFIIIILEKHIQNMEILWYCFFLVNALTDLLCVVIASEQVMTQVYDFNEKILQLMLEDTTGKVYTDRILWHEVNMKPDFSITAWGLFQLDFPLLLSFSGSVATFVVILVQIHILKKDSTSRSLLNASSLNYTH